jgi:GTP pyrophosphokinase
MPKGSTVLDFAFRIHTDVWLSFKSAIVNGVIKPIGYQPASGDIINIKTYRNKKTATKYRSDFLHTTSAKNKLQKYIKIHEKSEILKRSITILNSRLDERNLPHIGTQDDWIRWRYSETEWEKRLIDMYNKQESYSAFIKESYPKDRARAHTKTSQTKPTPARPSIARVTIDHNHHITYRLCTTCSPTQQDKIIAKSGRNGMVIHSVSCAWVRTASIQSLLEAHRYGLPITRYHATLIIKVQNLSKNMSNILQSIADTSITIDHIAIDNTNTDVGKLTLVTSYTNPAKFDYLRHALKKYEDFRNVRIQSIE